MINKNFNTQDQINYITNQSKITGLANCVAIVLTSYVISLDQEIARIMVWAGIGIFFIFLRFFCYRHVIPWLKPRDTNTSIYSKSLLILLFLLSGMTWSSAAIFFLGNPVEEAFTFIPIVIAGLAAASIPALAVYLPVYAAFAAPPLLGCALAYFFKEDYSLAFLSIAYLLITFTLAKSLGMAVVRSISIDKENAKLLELVTIEKEKSEEANRAKSRFFAAANHDLRQPMQAMGLLLTSLETRLPTASSDIEHILYQLNQSHDALSGLFNSLLEVSNLDGGAIKAKPLDISLDGLIDSLIAEFQVSAKAKGLKLIKKGSEESIRSDPILLSRILRNLLSNAIKFTQEGNVVINIESSNQKVSISVSDTGEGIPSNELEKIFDEYHQINNASRKRENGIGLGLSVVRKMADIMGLDISVESELGKGSTFSLEVPLGDKSQCYNVLEQPTDNELKGARILFIDDEINILSAMQILLEGWQCNLVVVNGVEAAMQSIKAGFTPELIISDYRLEGRVNGLDAILAIREFFSTALPAVIVTGDTAISTKEIISKEDCILMYKPIKPIILKNAIKSLVTN